MTGCGDDGDPLDTVRVAAFLDAIALVNAVGRDDRRAMAAVMSAPSAGSVALELARLVCAATRDGVDGFLADQLDGVLDLARGGEDA